MKYLLLRLVILIVAAAVLAGLILGLAGRWNLWNVWAYLGIAVILFAVQSLALYRKNPALLKEQMRPAGRELPSNRLPHIVSIVMFFLAVILAGLDQRFHWSDVVSLVGLVAGLVLVAMGLGLYTWAMSVNSFFSSVARIQADRDQRVTSVGPYAIVRHPGYAGFILFMVSSGLALNSLLAIIPAVLAGACFAPMTANEDRMLQDELAGYAEYAAKVRYRLIPGLW